MVRVLVEDDDGGGEEVGVGEGEADGGDVEASGGGGGGAVEADGGLTVRGAEDFDFVHGGVVADACAEGFGDGFFGGPACGVGGCGVGELVAVGAFGGGEDAAEEGVAGFGDGCGDARDVDEIDAGERERRHRGRGLSGFDERERAGEGAVEGGVGVARKERADEPVAVEEEDGVGVAGEALGWGEVCGVASGGGEPGFAEIAGEDLGGSGASVRVGTEEERERVETARAGGGDGGGAFAVDVKSQGLAVEDPGGVGPLASGDGGGGDGAVVAAAGEEVSAGDIVGDVEGELGLFGFGDEVGANVIGGGADPCFDGVGAVGERAGAHFDADGGFAVELEGLVLSGGEEVRGEGVEFDAEGDRARREGDAETFLEQFGAEFEGWWAETAIEAFLGADHGERARAGFAWWDGERDGVRGGEPFSGFGVRGDGDFERRLCWVSDGEFDETSAAAGGIESDRSGFEVDGEGAEPVDFGDEFRGEPSGIHDGADGEDGGLEAVGSDGDEIHVVDVASVGVVAWHGTSGGGEGDVFDAVADAVVAESVDVACEDGADIAGGFEAGVDLIPLRTGVGGFDPARVVEEDEDVAEVFGFGEGFFEPVELAFAHGLVRGFGEFALGVGAIAFIGEEGDEGAVFVFEPIVERAEVFFETGFVFAWWAVGAAPVDVVISGDWEPRHAEVVHDGAVFLHFLFPCWERTVAVDEVADGEDEVRVEEIGVVDGLVEDLEPFGRAAGAVAEDEEVEGVVAFGERERFCAFAFGVEGRLLGP